MRGMILLFLLMLVSLPVNAQEQKHIVMDIAEDHVDITSSFNGKIVTVFGTTDQDGDIAIVLRGTDSRIAVRKKQSSLGMWLNRQSVDFKHVPIYYSYATTRDERTIADNKLLRQLGIGINALDFQTVGNSNDDIAPEFQEALIRTQQAKGFFALDPIRVKLMGGNLFRADFYLPGNIPTGKYNIQGYLFKNGSLVDMTGVDMDVEQAGLSGSILNFAVDYSLAYAMFGVLMAALAGLAAFWMSRGQRT